MPKFVVHALFTIFAVVQCETIHFTNSPAHLLGSTNITSYKLLVKNADPITIIEANKEIGSGRLSHRPYHVANDRVDINVDNNADSPFNNHHHVKLVASMGGSHHVQMKNTQDIRGAIGITVTGDPSDFPQSDAIDMHMQANQDDANVKKLVYSPILLKKFIKEYNDKLQNADNGAKTAIKHIHDQIHDHQHGHVNRDKVDINDALETDTRNEDIEQKYGQSNRYHNKYDKNRLPASDYKDPDGWVTLDAIPWSSSTVSKWYPHGEETRRKPFPGSVRPYKYNSNKFSYQNDNGNNDDDYYNRPKPSSYDSRPNYSSWTKPQSYNPNGRPKPQPYTFTESGIFSQKYFNQDRLQHADHGTRYPGDLITDERPSNFPSESHYYDDGDHYNAAASNAHHTAAGAVVDHESNGDWVLISTTKGYQAPGNRRQYGQRAMPMTVKSDDESNEKPHMIRMHKAIKLTVLPPLDKAPNGTFSTDKKPTMTTIYDGMVEIDASHHSIDEDVRASQKKKMTKIPSPVKTTTANNVKRHRLVKGNIMVEEKSE